MGPVLSCREHPGVKATGTCITCLAPVCDVCTTYTVEGCACARCAQAKLLGKKRKRLFLTAALLLAVAAAVPFGYRAVKTKIDSGEPLTFSAKLAPLYDSLEKEPCNRDKIVPFCDELIAEGEPRYCLKRADAFFAKCGEFLRLRWLTYESHKRLSEFDAAISEATRLVDAYPDDKDYRWWRGIAYESKGDFAKAAEDYEQAIAIEPRLTGIPFNLAMAYQKLGRPCDGIFPLEQLTFHHPDRAENARRRLAELYDDPRCREHLARHPARRRLEPHREIEGAGEWPRERRPPRRHRRQHGGPEPRLRR
jgi:aspartyl protease family protein